MLWLLYNLFAAVDGLCDALFYGMLGADSFKWNEHQPLVTRRVLAVLAALGAAVDAVLVGVGAVEGWPVWLIWLLWEVVAAALSFSLFHNEAYNFGRVWIREQTLAKAWAVFEFNYQSDSTSARFDFDGTQRWVMAGAAVAWLVVGLVLLAKL
ncbi:hypothetical protein [Hymenobacter cellulosivorans]|uniref:DUF1772 domain-containing protein n=1 Tax=Hymenobacter cellulosivorans TaxID=2932249 RepID=A0ABY4F8P4_9BACT|nr:hypothetical protein [Hymenobacter cellulosivorans]UOQ53035.1 hypothetical protein MUN80_25275 [Hymenobacter cellulosivorans]